MLLLLENYPPLLPIIFFSCVLPWKIIAFKFYLWFNLENFSNVFVLCSLLDLTPYSFMDSADLLTTHVQCKVLCQALFMLTFDLAHFTNFHCKKFQTYARACLKQSPSPSFSSHQFMANLVSSILPTHFLHLYYFELNARHHISF